MSGGDPSKEIQHIPNIQSYPAPNNTERQTSMSVGFLTRTPQHREPHPYDINNSYLYPQPLMQQPNMPQQPHQSQRDPYDRPTAGPSHPSSVQSSSSTASPHNTQTPRITLPPLSAITENQETQTDGAPAPQNSQAAPVSPAQSSYPQSQQQSQQQPPQPSPPYPSRASSQYESQPAPYQHSSRHLQPSPQLAQDQSRYPAGQMVPQQVQVPPHQMPVGAPIGPMQSGGQIGQFPSPSPTPSHFPQQQPQYAYQQAQYPPQQMYGQYPPHQMAPQAPPGIPYQPAYATSHRQRPPQFSPYPPPPAGFPPQGAPQGWPQQDYIAQPLTPLNAHSGQQQYSPQMQQMQGPGGPMRLRRTTSGLGQAPYPPPGEPPQPPPQPQSQLKPKRKRATSGQLRVLNSVFASTFFPSTELRIALGKELNMSPRTVQIWFQNKRQSWRAHKAKTEHGTPTQPSGQAGISNSRKVLIAGRGSFSPHPLRQEQHFGSSPTHGRMSSTAEEGSREEGMENDEGGGWEALRQAQANRDFRGMPGVDQDDDVGFEEGGHEHHRHR